MQLTNQQIEDAVQALARFNPPNIGYKAKLRLARNLRKLQNAWNDKEHERTRLAQSCVTDQSKAPASQDGLLLTPAEQQKFAPLLKGLLAEVVEVEIHQIELFSSEQDETPADELHAIDISKTDIPPVILSALLDVVFVECGSVKLAA